MQLVFFVRNSSHPLQLHHLQGFFLKNIGTALHEINTRRKFGCWEFDVELAGEKMIFLGLHHPVAQHIHHPKAHGFSFVVGKAKDNRVTRGNFTLTFPRNRA